MKKIYYLFIFVFSFSVLSAQEKLSKEEKARREKNIQAGNPFAQFGYKAKIATLSKGKYLEFHDLDSIVTIGTVRWNVYKNEIVGHIVQDSLSPDAQPIGDRAGRWISPDPLSEEFPSWSPYNMCFDNPLRYKDPDGRAPTDWYLNLLTGGVTWKDGQGSRFGYKNLGHTWGSTDVRGNRFLMNGDTKQISYNGKVLQDFSKNKSAFDITKGFTIWGNDRSGDTSGHNGVTTESFESNDIPTLGNGDGKAGSIFSKVDNVLDQIIKFFEIADAAGDTMDRVQGVVTQVEKVKEEAKAKKEETKTEKPSEFIRTAYDSKTGNETWVRKDIYEAQQKKN